MKNEKQTMERNTAAKKKHAKKKEEWYGMTATQYTNEINMKDKKRKMQNKK